MGDWQKVVWERRPGALRNPRSMLVLDAFRGHTTDSVKNRLQQHNCDLVVIPGGMTSVLQPLDVSINKPFKQYAREEYEKWLETPNLPRTPAGKIKKVPPSTVAAWISTAWKRISEETIRKSFKKCCITNALDGSEDDIIWDDSEAEEDADTSSDENESDFESEEEGDDEDEFL